MYIYKYIIYILYIYKYIIYILYIYKYIIYILYIYKYIIYILYIYINIYTYTNLNYTAVTPGVTNMQVILNMRYLWHTASSYLTLRWRTISCLPIKRMASTIYLNDTRLHYTWSYTNVKG